MLSEIMRIHIKKSELSRKFIEKYPPDLIETPVQLYRYRYRTDYLQIIWES